MATTGPLSVRMFRFGKDALYDLASVQDALLEWLGGKAQA